MPGRPLTLGDCMRLHRLLADWHANAASARETASAYHLDLQLRLETEADRIEDNCDLNAPG